MNIVELLILLRIRINHSESLLPQGEKMFISLLFDFFYMNNPENKRKIMKNK